jgi:hypothetical protein
MTNREAFKKFGHTPIVTIDVAGIVYVTIYLAENLCWIEQVGEYQVEPDFNFPDHYIIDWFEDDVSQQVNVCTCDLFTVLMVTGCRCGHLEQERSKR